MTHLPTPNRDDVPPPPLPEDDQQALAEYNQAWFCGRIPNPAPVFPLPAEPSIFVWEEYAAEAQQSDWPTVLSARLPPFRFPIAEGISEDPNYRQAVRHGGAGNGESQILWRDPGSLRMQIVRPPSGPIPVLSTSVREDFETLLRVFLHRNEPKTIPPTMGAVMISGFVNRDRVNRLQESFFATHPGARRGAWLKQWEIIKSSHTDLFQDRLIIIGPGPYSGLPASETGFAGAEWQERSRTIRIHHECTHLFCKRVFGCMRNNLLDELLADFIGFREGLGHFSAHLFLRCMGISPDGALSATGRFYNYLKEPNLPPAVWEIQARLLAAAAHHLESWTWSRKSEEKDPVGQIILTLARFSLPELARQSLPETLASIQ